MSFYKASKMRQMFELINAVGQQVATTLTNQIKNGGEDTFEFREFARKFTVDVIATCALGIEVNSLENPKNAFHGFAITMINQFTKLITAVKIIACLFIPKVMVALRIGLFPQHTTKFFEDVIYETLKIREEKGIIRPDLINLLMQAKKGKLSHEIVKEGEKIVDGFATVEESHVGKQTVTTNLEDIDLAAQCFVFFFGG